MDKVGQLLSTLQRNGVVVGSTDATDAAVTLETGQVDGGGLLEEGLLGLVDVATLERHVSPLLNKRTTGTEKNLTHLGDAEANVHLGTRRLRRNDLVSLRMGLQGGVDELGLFLSKGLLAVNTVGESGEELLEDLARDVDTYHFVSLEHTPPKEVQEKTYSKMLSVLYKLLFLAIISY